MGSRSIACTADGDNTYLALGGPSGAFLIDCGGSPVHKLLRAGLDPLAVRGVLFTHSHPDHVYGFPALVQYNVEMGRAKDLVVFGRRETLAVVRRLWEVWADGAAPLRFAEVPGDTPSVVLSEPAFAITAIPVDHSVPALGLRIDAAPPGVSITYSGDTGPSERLVEAAAGSDLLIHECTVASPEPGHSTPEQAADAAACAGAKRLVLIHYPPELAADPTGVVERCSRRFDGPVSFARDGERFPLGPAA